MPHSDAIARIEQAQKLNGHARDCDSPGKRCRGAEQAAVLKLVTAYRSRGHLAAILIRWHGAEAAGTRSGPRFHGLSVADMDTEFSTGSLAGPKRLKLKDLIALLKATYANTIGAEFMHISDAEQRRWVHERLEAAAGNSG